MNRYRKGRVLEYEVMKIFRSNGWETLRTAGSHSPYDVILVKYGDENKKIIFLTFVQCKVRKLINKTKTDSPKYKSNNKDSDFNQFL